MKTYMADLHIHTCLSPCGSLRMSPRAIVDAALIRGLDLIAITDHNTCAMAPVVGRLARSKGLCFLYGIEVQTQEEVHLLAYFDNPSSCTAFSDEIYPFLPDVPNDPAYFGVQVVVDADEEIVRVEPKLLLNSVTLSLEEVVARVVARGGLAVPAHADRAGFGIIYQLGFIPPELEFSIIELDGDDIPAGCERYAVLHSSDAHYPWEIGRRTSLLTLEKVSVDELRCAAAGVNGRSIEPISVEGESHERY